MSDDEMPRAEQVLPPAPSRLQHLLHQGEQRAALLRRQVEELTRERDEAVEEVERLRGISHDPVFVDVDGRMTVTWPRGPGDVVVAPGVVDGWVDAVNQLRAENERLREQLAAAGVIVRERDELVNENERLRGLLAEAITGWAAAAACDCDAHGDHLCDTCAHIAAVREAEDLS